MKCYLANWKKWCLIPFTVCPEDLRTAITLRELEGLSYEEIAEIMDCPVGTVRSRIFRAREVIENKIQPLMQR